MRDRLTPTEINSRFVGDVYGLVADKYDSFYSDERSILENQEIKTLIELWNYRPPSTIPMSVLDIGCGTGLLLDLMADDIHPSMYHGIDISKGMLDQAREKHPNYSFRQYDYTQFHEQFDAVISLFGSMSYVPIETALDVVQSVTAPEGRFFLMFYNEGRRCRMFDVEHCAECCQPATSEMSFGTSAIAVIEALANTPDLKYESLRLFGDDSNFIILEGSK